jgi:hypothetical protein
VCVCVCMCVCACACASQHYEMALECVIDQAMAISLEDFSV